MFQTPCIIFAGGKSSRMGVDKSLLPFAAFDTLAEYQYTKLSQFFSQVYIVTKECTKFNFDAQCIEDISKTQSAPTFGFISAFEKLSDEKIFVLSVDTPFITQEIIEQLFKEDNADYDVTVARVDDTVHPICGIYHRSLLPKLREMMESSKHKLGFLLKDANTRYVDFTDEEPFFNLNHPHEYQEALKKTTR